MDLTRGAAAAGALAIAFASWAAASQVSPVPPAPPAPASPPVSNPALAASSAPMPAESLARVETDQGAFTIRLRPDLAPRHVRHFLKVARTGGFDGTTFHRIVPRGIIQGGDPLSKDPKKKALYGTGGLGLLKAELTPTPMARGAVAAVLRPRQPDSAGNQFFIVLADQPSLTGKYTVFGEIATGMDVVDKVAAAPVAGETPEQRLVIRKVLVETP